MRLKKETIQNWLFKFTPQSPKGEGSSVVPFREEKGMRKANYAN